MEELESNLKCKEGNPKRLNRQKFESIKRMQKACERGAQEYTCPNPVTILWCPKQNQPNEEVNESHILALEDLSRL